MKVIRKIKELACTLRFRLVVPLFITLIGTTLVLVYMTTNAYTQTILESEDAKVRLSFEISENGLLQFLQSAKNSTSALAQDGNISYWIFATPSNMLDSILTRNRILQSIENTLFQHPGIYGMLFLTESKLFGSLPYRNYFLENAAEDILGKPLLEEIRQIPRGETCWLGPVLCKDLYQIPIQNEIPERVMLGVTSLRISGTPVYALVVIDTRAFTEYVKALYDGRSDFAIALDNGTVLTSDFEGFSKEAIMEGIRRSGAKDGAFILKEDKEEVYISYHVIESLNWYFVRRLPMGMYQQTVSELRMRVLLISALLFFMGLVLCLYWMSGTLHSFEALRQAIRRMRNGQLNSPIKEQFKIVEFESIRREFNKMNDALEEMIRTQAAMERGNLEMELRNLQTQLSPHMIFNSISAIRWSATMVGDDRVADMLIELSEMLRPVFRDWKVEWTLGEELAHLDHYTKLLDLRFGNHFKLFLDVPEDMKDTMLPRFTLQPLVENVCEHGGVRELRVDVRAWIEDGRVHLTLKDNGQGIEAEQLEQIRRNISEGIRTDKIGISNVYARLILCRGDSCHMSVDCPQEGGTLVSMDWSVNAKAVI